MTNPIQRSTTPSPNATRPASPQPIQAPVADHDSSVVVAAGERRPSGVPPARLVPAVPRELSERQPSRPAPVAWPARTAQRLEDMPDLVHSEVANWLAPADLIGLGNVHNHAIATAIGPQIRAARIVAQHAPNVTRLAQFNEVLGLGATPDMAPRSIQALPPELQVPALVALGGRLLALAPIDQDQAIRAFLALDTQGESNALLDELRLAAGAGVHGLDRREAELVGTNGAASTAVTAGENVQAVAQRLAISGPAAMHTLERLALPRAHQALRQGESVPAVAERMGIASEIQRNYLEWFATANVGVPDVARGEAPAAVVARLGISNAASIHQLYHHGARHAVSQGRHVRETMRELNIPNTTDAIRDLEAHAVDTVGIHAVTRGENVEQVARRLGVSSPRLVAELELVSINRVGVAAMMQGESARGVAQRLGIRNHANIQRLIDIAAEFPQAHPRRE